VFTPVLAKHTKSFNLVDTLSVGMDRIQRNVEPMQRQVESWRQTQITDARAKWMASSMHQRAYCQTFICCTSWAVALGYDSGGFGAAGALRRCKRAALANRSEIGRRQQVPSVSSSSNCMQPV
jgi:hypothetical protein